MAKPRLSDVAREAGVSIGAASDALSGKNQIPESTRQRVRDAAIRLGYVPNPVARAMRKGHLPLLGLVIGALRRPAEYAPHRGYWGELIGAATLGATDRGYGVVVLPGLSDSQFDPTALAAVAVLSSGPSEPDLDLALSLGLPVLTDAPTDNPSAIVIDLRYAETVIAACDHLVERGATRPALLYPDLGTNFSIAMVGAYREWCRSRGVVPSVLDSSAGADGLRLAVEQALDDGVDGIYTVDGFAQLALDLAERRGLSIGRDLLVVELDDDTDGGCTRRGTTNISMSLADFVGAAIGRTIDVVNRSVAPDAALRCDLVLTPRSSTAGHR